jgi:hypothetical protein
MAYTYTLQKQYQKAIELEEEVAKKISEKIEAAPENKDLKLHLHRILELIANSYKKLGDLNKGFESLTRAYECIPYCNTCINGLLEYHHSNHDHQATINLLNQLADTPVPDEEYSRLTQTVWLHLENVDSKFQHFALDAAKATGTINLMVEAWKVAAKEARKALKMVTAARIELCLASFYSKLLDDEEEAVKRWENIMNTYVSSKDETKIGIVKLEAAYRLARHYLLETVNAGISTPEAEETAKKLEKLMIQPKGVDNYVAFFYQALTAQYLGVYQRLKGQQTQARDTVRPSVKHGIHILSDDEPENDTIGLLDLLTALSAVRDTKNVITVAYALGTYQEVDPDIFTVTWTCDGPCDRESPTFDGFSICTICFDWLCPDCVKQLPERTTAKNKCNSNHVEGFVHVPPRPKNVGKGTMLVDGEEMDFEAWKNLLRKEWGI